MNQIRIATWNFHCIPVPFGCPADHIEKVARYAQKLVQEHDIDILVLNEAFVAQARDDILASLRQVGPWNATPSDSTGPTHVGSGVVVAWRKDRLRIVGNTHKMTYSNCCQFDCLSQKGGLHLKLKTLQNVPFHVVATHMQAWEVPLLCNGVRQTQIGALKSMVEKLKQRGNIGPEEPVIFVGDFNEEPSPEFESGLGADHVTCEGACQTHEIGQVDNFYLQGGDRAWRQSLRSRIVHAKHMDNPSDHEPLMMKIQFL